MNQVVSNPPGASAYSSEEWEVRCDLAACYRLVAHFGWDDILATHISARLPGVTETFLINPFGLLFEEITASSLVKIDAEGNKLDDTPYEINKAGYVIHSAIHQARSDAGCVIHLHTKDGVAVSMTKQGLLPLNQTAMLIAHDIATHAYEGPALHLEERARLQSDLGNKNLMLLRNHGTLAVGRTVGEAFNYMYFLEWACTTQVRAMSMGQPLENPLAEVTEMMAGTPLSDTVGNYSTRSWPALLRKMDRLDPSYRD